MADWNTEFHGVSVKYQDRLIQIKTDKVLMDYLAEEGNGSVALAEWIHKEYKKIYGKKLDITVDSLSVEILVHAYLDTLARDMQKLPPVLGALISKVVASCCKSVEKHTEIIDCGEKAVDSNRYIFDGLAPFKGSIYKVLGKNA